MSPQNQPRSASRRAAAQANLATLRRRTLRIRRSVAALSVTLFVAAFAVVYVQLASGHDPALTANARKRAHVASKPAVTHKSTTQAPSTSSGADESGSTATESGSGSSSSGSSGSSGSESGSSSSSTPESSSSGGSESSSSGSSESSSAGSSESAGSGVTTRSS